MANKISDINSVQYYLTPSLCISSFENKSWFEKAMSVISSCGTLFIYAINRVLMVIYHTEKEMDRYTQAPMTNVSSRRLIVCLHGLNNNPAQFKRIVDEIVQKDNSESDIYIPKIVNKGNAKLDKMVSPILKDIAEWAKTGEEKELVLIGISNGGRVARAIEAELINSGQIGKIKHLKFISIVGACNGSWLVTLAIKLHISWILPKNIAKEMATDSERFERLKIEDEQAKKKSAKLKRDYTFIASPHDWQVPNYDSSLMEMTGVEEVRYSIVPNHGHNSIVDCDFVAESVAAIAVK
jgi:hypothetical protein